MPSIPASATTGLPRDLTAAEAANALFYEEQHMRVWWIWLILGLTVVFLLILPFLPIDEDAGTTEAILATYISAGVMMLVFLMMWRMRLRTWVLGDGVHVRYWPLVRHRVLGWDEIERYHAVRYSFLEYGGWGVRGFGGDLAYNAMGNEGVRFFLNGKRKLLVGSQRPAEFEAAVQQASGTDPAIT